MSALLLTIALLLPTAAFAAGGIGDVTGVQCTGFFLFCDLAGLGAGAFGQTIANRIANAILNFLALVTFIVIVWAAIQLIMGRGDLEKGKNTLLYAVGGYIAVRITFALVMYVVEFINTLTA